MCFPVKFAKFLRTPFFYRTPLMAASAWLQQEIMPVDINFERRDLTSAQKSHPSPDDLVETFCI